MSKQLEPIFSHSFKADIWEVLPSGNRLLITVRDHENLSVSFSLFSLDTNSFLWEDISFEENWWISVYHFVDDVIVFQTYNDTQDIESRSVFGFDINDMEALWSVEDVKLHRQNSFTLKLTSLEDVNEVTLIDIRSGSEVSERKLPPSLPEVRNELFPVHYEEGNPHFETLSKFLRLKEYALLNGSCDYLETEKVFAIAGNSKEETGYNLDLFVFSQEGDLLLQERLDKEMKGLATGTFFIVNQALIFVKGKQSLVLYSI